MNTCQITGILCEATQLLFEPSEFAAAAEACGAISTLHAELTDGLPQSCGIIDMMLSGVREEER